MQALHELRSRLAEHPILSLDLETTSKIPSEAQLEIVAMAAGYGPSLYAVALPPTTEVLNFVVSCLNDPTMRVVGHNLIAYDLVVLHHRNVYPFGTAKAVLSDTLPLVWLIDEGDDHGLKHSVAKFLCYTMTEYEEAYVTSANYVRAQELEHSKQRILEGNEAAKKAIEAGRHAESKRLSDELKARFKGLRSEKDKLERAVFEGRIKNYLESYFGDAMLHEIDERSEGLVKSIDEQIKEALKQWELDKYRYAADDARQTLRLYRTVRRELKNQDLLKWADIEIKNRIVGAAMQLSGMPIKEEKVKELKATFTPLIAEFEAQLYDTAKMTFNPNSPTQVKRILYDVLGAAPPDDLVSTNSTDEKTLSRIEHPFAQLMLNYRTIAKLNSTYLVRMEEEIAKGLPARLHAIFNSIGTVTGRWSSSKPNLQNIPSKNKSDEYDERIQKLGPKIREAFGPPPGWYMISADLSQIELRLIAQVTKDTRLIDVYNQHTVWNGIKFYTGDIHRNTSELLNIPRKLAKNCNFGLCLRKGTKILTKQGYVNIEDVKIGDLVLTHKKRWKQVTNLQRVQAHQFVKITTSTGKVLESTPDHMYYRYFPKANGLRGGCGWVSAEDLRQGDYLTYHGCGYPEGSVSTTAACRFLGWYLSEGSYRNYRLKISQSPTKNPDVARKMTETLTRFGFRWYDLSGSPHISAPVELWRPLLVPFSVDLAVKSKDKRIPEDAFKLDEINRSEILGALWDGDGSVCVSRGRAEITYYSKSRGLLNDVVRLLDSVGINARVYHYPSQQVNGVSVIGSKSKQRFLKIIPTVKAKRCRYRPKKQFDSDEKITNIKRITLNKDELVYDITVEEDHSFVANGIVTHNCYGMGPNKFARYAKLFIPGTKNYDVEQARKFVDMFMGLYVGIPDIMNEIEGRLNSKQKDFRLLTGRVRHFDKDDRQFPGMVLNTIIQGSAADLLKIIVWYIFKCIVQHPDFKGTTLSLQVHDEVGLFAPEDIAEQVGILVKYIMERAWFNLLVPVLASVKVCNSWADKDNDDIPEIGVVPPKELNIKPCVAMLTPDQEKWAAQYLPEIVKYSI